MGRTQKLQSTYLFVFGNIHLTVRESILFWVAKEKGISVMRGFTRLGMTNRGVLA